MKWSRRCVVGQKADGGSTAVTYWGWREGRCTVKWDLVSFSGSIRGAFKVLYISPMTPCLLCVASDVGG